MDNTECIPTGPAARIVGFSTKTLLRYAKRGKVPGAYQLVEGGSWRFNEQQLRNWVRRREAACREQAEISINATGSGTPELKSADASIAEAYERLLGRKRSNGSKRSRNRRNT